MGCSAAWTWAQPRCSSLARIPWAVLFYYFMSEITKKNVTTGSYFVIVVVKVKATTSSERATSWIKINKVNVVASRPLAVCSFFFIFFLFFDGLWVSCKFWRNCFVWSRDWNRQIPGNVPCLAVVRVIVAMKNNDKAYFADRWYGTYRTSLPTTTTAVKCWRVELWLILLHY